MGLFDFLKPKKTATQEYFEKISNEMFPKGERDINAGTDELLCILNSKIDRETAKGIFLKSMAIGKMSENFDEKRLRDHLSGYCLEYFNPEQIKKFHNYLTALNVAMMVNRKTPSEVRREGDSISEFKIL